MNVCRNYGMTCELANENGYCIITGCIKREYKMFSEAIPKANKNLVEVIRCKECKYGSDNKVYGCSLINFNTDEWHRMYADDFCSRGERKESE